MCEGELSWTSSDGGGKSAETPMPGAPAHTSASVSPRCFSKVATTANTQKHGSAVRRCNVNASAGVGVDGNADVTNDMCLMISVPLMFLHSFGLPVAL